MHHDVSIDNAAGTCKTIEQVGRLAHAVDKVVSVGSIVVPIRSGNDGDVYYRQPDPSHGSVNRLGIPCLGHEHYEQHLPAMVRTAHAAGKQLCVSIAALEPGDLAYLAALCQEADVDIIEVNAGCAHLTAADGRAKPLPSYNPPLLARMLGVVWSLCRGQELRVKLSPYFDILLIEQVAQVLAERPYCTPVFCNTLPNILMRREDNGREAVSGGLGGHGGSDVFRWIVCGTIKQFRMHLPNRRFIGVGGIREGKHLLEYLSVGVTETQVATAYYDSENPRVFQDIREEFASILEPSSPAVAT